MSTTQENQVKVINKDNMTEVDFNIYHLDARVNYIAMDADGRWFSYFNRPIPTDGIWYDPSISWQAVPHDQFPKKFFDSWMDSLFEIKR